MRPDPRAEPDEAIVDALMHRATSGAATRPLVNAEPDDAPDTLPAPPPVPSTGSRTRPSSPRALRIADILAEARRAAGLDEDPAPKEP